MRPSQAYCISGRLHFAGRAGIVEKSAPGQNLIPYQSAPRNAIYPRNINLIYLNMERGLIIIPFCLPGTPIPSFLLGDAGFTPMVCLTVPAKYYREIVQFFWASRKSELR